MKSLMRKIVLEYDNKYKNTMKKYHLEKLTVKRTVAGSYLWSNDTVRWTRQIILVRSRYASVTETSEKIVSYITDRNGDAKWKRTWYFNNTCFYKMDKDSKWELYSTQHLTFTQMFWQTHCMDRHWNGWNISYSISHRWNHWCARLCWNMIINMKILWKNTTMIKLKLKWKVTGSKQPRGEDLKKFLYSLIGWFSGKNHKAAITWKPQITVIRKGINFVC